MQNHKYIRKRMVNGHWVYDYADSPSQRDGLTTQEQSRKDATGSATGRVKKIGPNKYVATVGADINTYVKNQKAIQKDFSRKKIKSRVNRVISKLRKQISSASGAAKKQYRALLNRAKSLKSKLSENRKYSKKDKAIANKTGMSKKQVQTTRQQSSKPKKSGPRFDTR